MGANALIGRVEAANIEPAISPKSNRKEPRVYDRALYKARHLIENFFEKLKHYRAIATRYDKTAAAFLGATTSQLQSFGSINDTA